MNILSVDPNEFLKELRSIIKDELASFRNEDSPNEVLLDSKQVKELLGISHPTLSKWCNSGYIKSYRLGGKVLFKQSEVMNDLQKVRKYQK